MGETEKTVLKLLRKALWAGDGVIDSDADWRLVFEEMKNQAVVAIAGDVLSEISLDPSVRREWSREAAFQITRNEQSMFEQGKLLSLLAENDIPAVILKGAAAAQYYPHPEYRTTGDVDFLVPEERFMGALDLLLENGFQQISKVREGYCEVALQKNGVIFEIHRGLNDYGAGIEVINSLISEDIYHSEMRFVCGYSLPVLPELSNGLVLLSHLRQHFVDGLGLRQVTDWMMYVSRALDDATYLQSFAPLSKQCGLEKLAITATRMCQMYLGLSEDITWCKTADEALCRDFMVYVFENGNFGRKVKGFDRASRNQMIKKHFFVDLLVSLQRKGKMRSVVKRHAVLRPFAWLIQIFHLFKQIARRGNIVKTLKNDRQKAKRQSQLFVKLEIALK